MTATHAPQPGLLALARQLASLFAALPTVEAVALGGSLAAGAADAGSDIDLYVFTRGEITLDQRRAIVGQSGGASKANLGLNYWGPGDEWIAADSGVEVDIVYFETDWVEDQLRRVIDESQPAAGYTTCIWRTLRDAQPYFDRSGWLQGQQTHCRADYPEALRRNIIAFNHPLLRAIIPAYARQIEKAVLRDDRVSINHRLAALLASYFDILLAFNKELHPGEKRLQAFTQAHCARLPEHFAEDLTAALRAAGDGGPALIECLARLLDRLDALLASAGLLPPVG